MNPKYNAYCIYKQWDQCFNVPILKVAIFFFFFRLHDQNACVCLCVDLTHLSQFLTLLSLHNPFMCGISLKNQSIDQWINQKTMHYVLALISNQCFLYKLFMNWCHKCTASPKVIRFQISNKWSIYNISACFTLTLLPRSMITTFCWANSWISVSQACEKRTTDSNCIVNLQEITIISDAGL